MPLLWFLPSHPFPQHLASASPGTQTRWGSCSPALPVLRHLQEPQQTLEAMLRPKVTTLPGHIQAVYVQNVVKLYAAILQQKEQAADAQAAQEVTQLLVERLPQFVQSADLEAQERVSAARQHVLRGSGQLRESSLGRCSFPGSPALGLGGWADLKPPCWGGPGSVGGRL